MASLRDPVAGSRRAPCGGRRDRPERAGIFGAYSGGIRVIFGFAICHAADHATPTQHRARLPREARNARGGTGDAAGPATFGRRPSAGVAENRHHGALVGLGNPRIEIDRFGRLPREADALGLEEGEQLATGDGVVDVLGQGSRRMARRRAWRRGARRPRRSPAPPPSPVALRRLAAGDRTGRMSTGHPLIRPARAGSGTR
jgi:hypothetical protein